MCSAFLCITSDSENHCLSCVEQEFRLHYNHCASCNSEYTLLDGICIFTEASKNLF